MVIVEAPDAVGAGGLEPVPLLQHAHQLQVPIEA